MPFPPTGLKRIVRMTPPTRVGSFRQPATSTVNPNGPVETGAGAWVAVDSAVASFGTPGVPSNVGVKVMMSVPVTGVAVATPINGAGVLTIALVVGAAFEALVGAKGGSVAGIIVTIAGTIGVGAELPEPSEQAISVRLKIANQPSNIRVRI